MPSIAIGNGFYALSGFQIVQSHVINFQFKMDRRSWLWRRKSSEKSPGETESSGSVSSHSERFFDDQECSNQRTQSPEVTSKSAPSDEELNDSVKTLTEKLSAALLNIRAKDDLVKQHTKVAEEAVSGWEKAESEVSALKQQLEIAVQKNTALEDRVGHLDGALKECVRQLRQSREEQEQKIHETVSKKMVEWEFTKSEFESHLAELESRLQASKAESLTSNDLNLRPKLDAAEKENSALKLELVSRAKELEIRVIERDLSTQAAETASKQHLESIKKVAKLEAECRRLKAMVRKASAANDQRSITASSVYVESFTDSQSDSGERLLVVENDRRKISGIELNECEPSHSDSWASSLIAEVDQFKNEKALGRNLMAPSSVEINLMDDFLEMERLAGLPETESGCCYPPESGTLSDQPHDGESPSKAEFEAMITRIAELEEKLVAMEMEKLELEVALTECQDQLKRSRDQFVEAEVKLVELETLLAMEKEARIAADAELKAANAKREFAESEFLVVEAEVNTLLSKVGSLEEDVQKDQALSGEAVAKCRKMENEIFRLEEEVQKEHALSGEAVAKCRKLEDEILRLQEKFQKEQASSGEAVAKCRKFEDEILGLKEKFQKEQASLGEAVAKCRKMEDEIFRLDEEVQEEQALSGEAVAKCQKMEVEILRLEKEVQKEQASSGEAVAKCRKLEDKIFKLEEEVQKEQALSGEAMTKCRKMEDEIFGLEKEAQKEHALSAEAMAKCHKMEEEMLRMKLEVEIPNAATLNGALKIKQEKELAVAASKLAECQKTIASLGQQLKSLATLEDFLVESEKSSELPKHGSQYTDDGPELRKLHYADLYSAKWGSQAPRNIINLSGILENGRDR